MALSFKLLFLTLLLLKLLFLKLLLLELLLLTVLFSWSPLLPRMVFQDPDRIALPTCQWKNQIAPLRSLLLQLHLQIDLALCFHLDLARIRISQDTRSWAQLQSDPWLLEFCHLHGNEVLLFLDGQALLLMLLALLLWPFTTSTVLLGNQIPLSRFLRAVPLGSGLIGIFRTSSLKGFPICYPFLGCPAAMFCCSLTTLLCWLSSTGIDSSLQVLLQSQGSTSSRRSWSSSASLELFPQSLGSFSFHLPDILQDILMLLEVLRIHIQSSRSSLVHHLLDLLKTILQHLLIGLFSIGQSLLSQQDSCRPSASRPSWSLRPITGPSTLRSRLIHAWNFSRPSLLEQTRRWSRVQVDAGFGLNLQLRNSQLLQLVCLHA